MPTVTINSVQYEVYADITTADEYLAAKIGSTWSSQDADTKAQALVTATRYIDRQPWKGSKTSDAQALEWPRTGVTDKNGDAVDDSTVPQQVIDASILFANLLISDNEADGQASFGNNTKRLKAGPAEIEYFKDTPGTRFPSDIQALIAQFLSGAGSSSVTVGGVANGTDKTSAYQDWRLNEGYY